MMTLSMETKGNLCGSPASSLARPSKSSCRHRRYWIAICLIFAVPSSAFTTHHPSKTSAATTTDTSFGTFLQDRNCHDCTNPVRLSSTRFGSNGSIAAKSRQEESKNIDHQHVWIWQDDINNNDSGDGIWKQPDDKDKSTAEEVTTLVTNWCENFVLKLDLCPWAKASLQTNGAMRFFLVPPPTIDEDSEVEELELFQEQQERWMEEIVETVAERFQAEILNPATNSTESDETTPFAQLEKAAIYFVVFLPSSNESLLPNSFVDFSYWFMDMEEEWKEEYDNVIVAPFHPSWRFGQDDEDVDNNFGDDNDVDGKNEKNGDGFTMDDCLDYEKRSPYPLVTLVSTRVVENAGAAVTEAIGEHNEEVLVEIQDRHRENTGDKSQINASVSELWWSAVYGGNRPIRTKEG